jgi:phenylpropionate dioxygenase-like ring-hydroxylating dioxygenase large terminal subunit
VSKENVYVTRYEINCNWLQAMEGDYDPSHVFVHSTLGANRDVAGEVGGFAIKIAADNPIMRTVALEETAIGVMYADARQVNDGEMSVMANHCIMPCFPNAGLSQQGVFNTNIRVPIDNEHENHYRLRWTRRGFTEKELYDFKYGGFIFPLHEPGTYLAKQRLENDYGHDPVLQRQFNFSGVVPFPTQDLMMIENQWGAIAKREREHLVSSDREIIGIRRRLLRMAKNLANGIEPEEPFLLKGIRQEYPDPVVVPKANRLDASTVEQIISGLNTNRLSKEGTEDEVMWTPSVEADDAGMPSSVQ